MRIYPLLATAIALAATAAAACQHHAPMTISVDGIHEGQRIADAYALCVPTADGKYAPGANTRPTIAWKNAPAGTQSFAILVADPDVPADFTNASREGAVVEADAPRQLFYHWALADIPASVSGINGGSAQQAPLVGRAVQGSLGKYLKRPWYYGGPCPPWNDARLHHYSFTVYALDVPRLRLPARATAADVRAAMEGHVLASASVTGNFTTNPALMD